MRIAPVLALIGACALSSLAAAEPSIPASSPSSMPSVGIQAARLTAEEAANLAGNFKMQDGRRLTLFNDGNTLYMEMKGKQEELVPVSKTRFVGRSSGTEIALHELGEKVDMTQWVKVKR